jgi:Putative prokaryotic signal transducing protein
MKVDAEDFRRVYESMNDTALLAVNREDLVAVAQQCYDAEVARRGLAAAGESVEAEAEAAEAAGESAAMVELATFTDVDDARMARALLEAAEIPCYLANDDPMAGSWTGIGGFRLSVPTEWLEQAQEVLETQISDEELAAQAEAAELEEGNPEE